MSILHIAETLWVLYARQCGFAMAALCLSKAEQAQNGDGGVVFDIASLIITRVSPPRAFL